LIPLFDRIPRLYDAVSHIWWKKSTPGRAFAGRLLPPDVRNGIVQAWNTVGESSHATCLAIDATVTRDQFKILPMPDLVVAQIKSLTESKGYTRGIDPDVGPLEVDNDDRDMQLTAPLPDMIGIDGRNGVVQLADHCVIAPAAGVYDDVQRLNPESQHDEGKGVILHLLSRYRLLSRHLLHRCQYKDRSYQLSVMAGVSTPCRAYSTIRAELS
jgi:hypothetical protein